MYRHTCLTSTKVATVWCCHEGEGSLASGVAGREDCKRIVIGEGCDQAKKPVSARD